MSKKKIKNTQIGILSLAKQIGFKIILFNYKIFFNEIILITIDPTTRFCGTCRNGFGIDSTNPYCKACSVSMCTVCSSNYSYCSFCSGSYVAINGICVD